MKIGIVGLGYVGMPLALAFAREFDGVVGFDVSEEKVAALKAGEDPTREGMEEQIRSVTLDYSADPVVLEGCDFLVVAVPTPIDRFNRPDLSPLLAACRTVGSHLKKGTVVVFESTVYPGVTEEVCGPILEEVSGLKSGVDFKLGYSPERINPGDSEHTLSSIIKVVSGEDEETLKVVADAYSRVVSAGVHEASSIKVAEAAKVIENTQRDLNIALMNELSIIFDRIGISTKEVLDAASSKWNFHRFEPGLVGGHCIGVDPYYLTTKAEELGYRPQVILAGRRINDGMGQFVAQRLMKLMINAELPIKNSKVGILGLTFKENVSDIRNSRVPDIVKELGEFGVETKICDPFADDAEVREEYGISLSSEEDLKGLDALVLAVPHRQFLEGTMVQEIVASLKAPKVFVDIKAKFQPEDFDSSIEYWAL